MATLTPNLHLASAHWYTANGHPAHVQLRNDNRGTRPTTIKDAMSMNLYPSVTSILNVFAKPGLETWKIKQAILAAARTLRSPEESVDYWTQRVMNAAHSQVEAAADLGTNIHRALDLAISGELYDPALQVYVQPVMAWIARTFITFTAREIVLVNRQEGYAGRVDALFTYGTDGIGIIDWKTRKTKPGETITPYDGQAMQLAAYAAAHYGEAMLPRVLAANVYISTTEPGRIAVCRHEGLPEVYEAFKHACALWRHLKGYDPRNPARSA